MNNEKIKQVDWNDIKQGCWKKKWQGIVFSHRTKVSGCKLEQSNPLYTAQMYDHNFHSW